MIITDKLDLKSSSRANIKAAAIALKTAGVSRVLGIGVAAAHDWDKRSIRKTWKAIASRYFFIATF